MVQTLSITIPEELRIAMDKEAKLEHTKRSTFIQKAVSMYLDLKHNQRTRSLLREGYGEITGENQKIMAEFAKVDQESWKYVP